MKIRARLKSDSGSAIVEFVALAIPLFIPIFIYLNHFSSVSVNEEIARSMAREVLRVYVISEDESAARNLLGKAMNLLAHQWKLTDSEVASMQTHLNSLPIGQWQDQINNFFYRWANRSSSFC